MLEWLTEPFSVRFMQQALLGGLLAAVTTALIGTWVVIRGMAFMGDALAHGVLPGIALAFVLGVDLTLGAIAGALVMVAGIVLVHRRAALREDTGIGLLFVGMLALGVIIISRTLLTLAIVSSFRAVGTLLVFGLLIAPPATAALLARSVPVMMLTAVGIGSGAVVIGLLLSWHLGTAAGATVAGVAVLAFFMVLVGRDLVRWRPAPKAAGPEAVDGR
jgi:ABC-type Mn2+/Zn2+ transport system permease subunit